MDICWQKCLLLLKDFKLWILFLRFWFVVFLGFRKMMNEIEIFERLNGLIFSHVFAHVVIYFEMIAILFKSLIEQLSNLIV